MSTKTKIEWTDTTWNPVRGCALVSHGCTNCYAMRQAHRFSGPGKPYDGLTKLTNHGPVWTGAVRLVPELLQDPFRWITGRKVFVNSMGDLFHEDVPFEFIADVFSVMSVTTRHVYQILTKRPVRALEFFRWLYQHDDMPFPQPAYHPHYFPELISGSRVYPSWKPWREGKQGGYDNCGPRWPLDNVWLGVSVEDQATADGRIPLLLHMPAAIRWISAEPLLGPISFVGMFANEDPRDGTNALAELDWVVAGGESGPNARPAHPEWIRELRDQCLALEVPFFFKQWGAWHPCDTETHADERGREIYPHNEQLFDNLDRATGFQVIEAHGQEFFKAGKKLAGRLLDGRTWDEYPR